jgi:putative redox protein
MVQMTGIYQGEKHCALTHEASGSHLETDAPKDNHGKGERFSPTDLVGAALGSCIVTTMAIQTEKDGLNLKGTRFEIEKIMSSNPRRISELRIAIVLPQSLSAADRQRLEKIAWGCPVKESLHPDLKVDLQFDYSLAPHQ